MALAMQLEKLCNLRPAIAHNMAGIHELGRGLVAAIGFNGRRVTEATAVGKAIGAVLGKGTLDKLPLPVVPMRPLLLDGLRLPWWRAWPNGRPLRIDWRRRWHRPGRMPPSGAPPQAYRI